MMKLADGQLLLDGTALLENVPTNVAAVEDSLGHGVFLRTDADAPAARLTSALGHIAALARFTACHRYEPFWMRPTAGTRSHEIPVETQSLLVERTDGTCVLIVPILDGPMRCALEGDADGRLVLIAESCDPAVAAKSVVGVYVAAGPDPFALCRTGAQSVIARLKTGRLRKDKLLPAFADQFGWCTWDAFYGEVSHDKVRQGLETFKAGGLQPRMMILDDGWQSVTKRPATGEKRLTAFAANEKFPGDLGPTVTMAKTEFGIETFLVWHAFQGYWGGVDETTLPGYGVRDTARSFGAGILHHFPQANEKWWGAVAGVVSAEHVYRFYQDYHRHLRQQDVDGVKVDNQATQEGLGTGQGGRVRFMQTCHAALEGSVQVHFGGNLINCMSCSNDMLYSALASTLTRTSTDFWPKRPETHGLHLYTNAQVGLWFGQFVHPDWDMFQSGHEMGGFHAAGRAVSGAPVYVSDKPGTHDFALLRKLVCTDGSVLRCDGPGLPTRDCLFADVTKGQVALKIWNTNRAGAAGVVGLFHAGYHAEAAERKAIDATLSPADVPELEGDRFVLWLHRDGKGSLVSPEQRVTVHLEEGGWEVATIVPVRDGVAVVGLADKLNGGGAVTSEVRAGRTLQFTVRDAGDLVLWSAKRPAEVRANGRSAAIAWEEGWARVHLAEAGTVVVALAD